MFGFDFGRVEEPHVVFLFLILLTEFPNIRVATEEEEAEGDDPLYIFPPALTWLRLFLNILGGRFLLQSFA